MTEPLPLGSTIGILGGGQLARMLSVAAARLGYRCHVFEPGAAPAADVAADWTQARYDDAKALAAFTKSVDVVTYEFENVPAESLDLIETHLPIRPARAALALSQDRLTEKQGLNDLGVATAPFKAVETVEDLDAARKAIGPDGILKTRRLGYDGKGQVRIGAETSSAEAIAALAGAPAILEGFIPFTTEVSVIAARGQDGEVVAFDPGENRHEGGILYETVVPAKVPSRLTTDAVLVAGKILNALDYVGVLGVEFFVTPNGLIVNEIAPRVHNSGHWTQDGCITDQFEQHIRAVAGLPLGDGRRIADVRMENLLGSDVTRAAELARDPSAALHIYGKTEVREGRKMGHVNFVTAR